MFYDAITNHPMPNTFQTKSCTNQEASKNRGETFAGSNWAPLAKDQFRRLIGLVNIQIKTDLGPLLPA